MPDPSPAHSRDLGRLLAGYRPLPGVFDEMLAADGTLRPHWEPFLTAFAGLGEAGRRDAAERTRLALRESGIAFAVDADPDDGKAAWRLDMVPLLLPEREWSLLVAGLTQRARLIEATLGDLYGRQTLIRQGVLPPSLFLGAEELVRESVRREGAPGRFLHAYACDLARDASGRWVVLADQVDTAIGNGYVLASRAALSRGLAEPFRAARARRLDGFYQALRSGFQERCRRDDGRICILSPGPESPSYFSHAYLARHLGYTLAEGGDLSVRDSAVHLKTLDGLQRVELLLSKLAGHQLDPLHARGGARGVPGLFQALRADKVVVANRPGSGVLQHRALAAFSHRLCRRLLGEHLQLADHECFWLGEAAGRQRVQQRPEQVRLTRATARNDPGDPCRVDDPGRLSEAERAALGLRLEREGHLWVAQPPLPLATMPAMQGEDLVPRHYAMRAFLVAQGDDWAVLPGGLVRLAGEPESAVLPNGYGSKDVWIVGGSHDQRAATRSGGGPGVRVLRRAGRDLLSRTADHLFWLGRYAERAEALLRLLRGALTRLDEDGRFEAEADLLTRLVLLPLQRAGPAVREPFEVDALLRELAFSGSALSLRTTLDQLHRNAVRVRDQVSDDAWRMLSSLHLERRWREPRAGVTGGLPLDLVDEGVRLLYAFGGTEAENMTRNQAWRFLEMGRRLERALHVGMLVREVVLHAEDPVSERALQILLELGESGMTYRSRYLAAPLLAPVLDLLLLDPSNPRGAAFQLDQLAQHVARLPNRDDESSEEERLVLRMLTKLRLTDARSLAEGQAAGASPELEEVLAELQHGLPRLSDRLERSYFTHVEPATTILLDEESGRT